MAATKKSAKPKATAPAKKTKAEAPKTTVKKAPPKKAAPKQAAAPAPAPVAEVKAAPKPEAKVKAKKAAPKLTEKQVALLAKVGGALDGYVPPKAEARSIEALMGRKLVKKGAKVKATGVVPFHLTKAGLKHLPAPAPVAPVAPPTAAPEILAPPPA